MIKENLKIFRGNVNRDKFHGSEIFTCQSLFQYTINKVTLSQNIINYIPTLFKVNLKRNFPY